MTKRRTPKKNHPWKMGYSLEKPRIKEKRVETLNTTQVSGLLNLGAFLLKRRAF